MKFLPKNLCKKLSVVNGIGTCDLRNCLCRCWNCEINNKCGAEVFEKCQLKSVEFKEIPNAFALYDDAVKIADKEIHSLMEREDPISVVGGLLYRREAEILHCFYDAPGDLPSAVSTANSYINRDLSAIGHDDVKYTEEANKVWNLIVAKEVFSNQSNRLRNGDLLCFGNEQGQAELRSLVSNPIHYIEQLDEFVKKKTSPQYEGENVRLVYSRKMLPITEWCLVNVHQADMWDYTLYKNFTKILKHLEDVANSGEISPRICYRLAYPHYAGMLHTCRYIYSKFKHIKIVSQLNKGIDETIKNKYAINFDIEKNYDAFLSDLWHTYNYGKMCISETIGKDTEDYRFIIKDGTLFGSALLLGFISKNYESICLKPYERGPAFEDFVEKELLDRQVVILKRNFETPKGEVDFICSKNGKTYFIEAKDYSPWFDYSYIGSKTYNERVESINEKLENAPPRLQWIESNPRAIGLSAPQKLIGIILTRFSEPHIRIPAKFQYATIDDLDDVFGKSRYCKIYETCIKLRPGEEERLKLEKELLEKKVQDFTKYGLR